MELGRGWCGRGTCNTCRPKVFPVGLINLLNSFLLIVLKHAKK